MIVLNGINKSHYYKNKIKWKDMLFGKIFLANPSYLPQYFFNLLYLLW